MSDAKRETPTVEEGAPVSVAAPIHRLPVEVANQLAAGEVVERPAAAIKELVENSLDAGARKIAIDLEAGGIELLRVTDDGGGIRREQLALALERHATSKITSLDDLMRVASLGFRGEALASIAAVSRLTLTSRPADEASGWRVRGDAAGGGAGEPEPARHPVGTTVEARDLFHNVPARRRFLRTPRTELQHVLEVVRRLALARPDVEFRVRHGERSVFHARAGDEAGRLDEVFGTGFAAKAAPVSASSGDGLDLRGRVGTGAGSGHQYFFLNGRAIRDRAVGHAIRVGLEGLIAGGQSAHYALFLALDPALVDVNVHPGKHEVRFWNPRLVHDFLVSGLRRALGGALEGMGDGGGEGTAPSWAPAPLARRGTGERGEEEAGARAPRSIEVTEDAWFDHAPLPGSTSAGGGRAPRTVPEPSRLHGHRPPRASRPASRPPSPGRTSGDLPARETPAFVWIGERYAIGVARPGGAPLAIDVPRALSDALRAACAKADAGEAGALHNFPLLMPVRVQVAEDVLERFEPESVARYGLVMRRMGPDTATVLELPRELRWCRPDALARAVIEAPPDQVPEVLAAHAAEAVPANPGERDELVRDLLARPEARGAAVRELGERELARLFER